MADWGYSNCLILFDFVVPTNLSVSSTESTVSLHGSVQWHMLIAATNMLDDASAFPAGPKKRMSWRRWKSWTSLTTSSAFATGPRRLGLLKLLGKPIGKAANKNDGFDG